MDSKGVDLKKPESGSEDTAATRAGKDFCRIAYDYETAAAWLEIKLRKLQRLVAHRSISHVKIGREIRFRQVDLDEYLLRCVRPVADQSSPPIGGGTPPGVGTSWG